MVSALIILITCISPPKPDKLWMLDGTLDIW